MKLLKPVKKGTDKFKMSHGNASSDVESSAGTMPKLSQVRSLNGIDKSIANIDSLYKFTLCKIRTIQELKDEGEPPILDEEVLKKKVISEMPKKLPIFSQKPPSLDELVKIAAEMGVVLSYKMAN